MTTEIKINATRESAFFGMAIAIVELFKKDAVAEVGFTADGYADYQYDGVTPNDVAYRVFHTGEGMSAVGDGFPEDAKAWTTDDIHALADCLEQWTRGEERDGYTLAFVN